MTPPSLNHTPSLGSPSNHTPHTILPWVTPLSLESHPSPLSHTPLPWITHPSLGSHPSPLATHLALAYLQSGVYSSGVGGSGRITPLSLGPTHLPTPKPSLLTVRCVFIRCGREWRELFRSCCCWCCCCYGVHGDCNTHTHTCIDSMQECIQHGVPWHHSWCRFWA